MKENRGGKFLTTVVQPISAQLHPGWAFHCWVRCSSVGLQTRHIYRNCSATNKTPSSLHRGLREALFRQCMNRCIVSQNETKPFMIHLESASSQTAIRNSVESNSIKKTKNINADSWEQNAVCACVCSPEEEWRSMLAAGQADCYVAGAQRSDLGGPVVSGCSWVWRTQRVQHTHARTHTESLAYIYTLAHCATLQFTDQGCLVNECRRQPCNSLLVV